MSITFNDLRNLKVISKINIGDKLCTRTEQFTIDPCRTFSLRLVWRMVTGDNREDTIESITKLCEKCIKNSFIKSSREEDIEHVSPPRLAKEFKGVVSGLKNLSETYKDDVSIVSIIEIIIERLDDYIKVNSIPEM